MREVELLTVGRVNLDLYAHEVDVPFVDVTSFEAMVGGSPVNVALAASRLGIHAGTFTAVGADLVGDWVVHALERDGVDTTFVSRKPGRHTSLALLAQRPPDDKALVFYRQDPADIHLTEDDVAAVELDGLRVLLVSADALARGTTALAVSALLAGAKSRDLPIYLDLDYREVNWPDVASYAVAVLPVMEQVDVVLGTEFEFAAVLDRVGRELIDTMALRSVAEQVRVLKRGGDGATLFAGAVCTEIAAYDIAEASSVGAGDSFAAGLITARLDGADWPAAAEFASACAAVTVSRFACSTGFPFRREVDEFLGERALVSNGS